MNHYFTFGQSHVHRIQGKTIDCDCVARVKADTHEEARNFIFMETEGRFCFSYDDSSWSEEEQMPYFPRGYIDLEVYL